MEAGGSAAVAVKRDGPGGLVDKVQRVGPRLGQGLEPSGLELADTVLNAALNSG